MLPFNQFYNQIQEWKKKRQWGIISESCKRRLDAREMVRLPEGSYWRWMYKTWFDLAKKEGVIQRNECGQWLPAAEVSEEQVATGQRGREVMYEKKKRLNLSRFYEFAERYNLYEQARNKEQYHLQLVEGDRGLGL